MTLGSQLEAGENGEKGPLNIPLTNGKKNETVTGKEFHLKTFFTSHDIKRGYSHFP